MRIHLALLLSSAVFAGAQTDDKLPPRLEQLQMNYEAAIQRATAPLTLKYIDELRKAKNDYLKAGDLAGAQAANDLLNEALTAQTKEDTPAMTMAGFKRWLGKVKITEIDSPFKIAYTYDDHIINSSRPDRQGLRPHRSATIETGKIVVPFTDTQATISIHPNLSEATVTYSTDKQTYKASITKK